MINNITYIIVTTCSRVLLSQRSQYWFSNLSHGTKYQHIKSIMLAIGTKTNNWHHHDHHISCNLLLLRIIFQYKETSKNAIVGIIMTRFSRSAFQKAEAIRIMIPKHKYKSNIKITPLATYFALQILLSVVHVIKLAKEFSLYS